MLAGRFFGLSRLRFWPPHIITPILHQVYVWLAWRSELTSQRITRCFGKDGFSLCRLLHRLLGCPPADHCRAGLLEPLYVPAAPRAYLHAGSRASSSPRLPVLLGAQALRLQARLRHRPFRRFLPASAICQTRHLSPDGQRRMFSAFVLWTPGLFFLSQAALWSLRSTTSTSAHYYCTELPDIRHIYGQDFCKEHAFLTL